MSRNLVAVNAALAALATALVVYIASQFVARAPLPAGGRRPPQPVTSAGTVEAPRAPASAYNVVAARNLFSPTRTEATSATSVAATPLVRPNLFGVVVRDGGSIAYLEDPTTKRVAGYRVGDQILGGKVQAIRGDVVTIDAPGLPGVIPPAAPPAAAAPSQPQVAQPPMQPAQPPQPMMPGQPPVVGVPTQPNVVNPQAVPGRRALPPNLLRRLPPGTGDAPQQ
jgi:hypothetical protein